MMRLFASGALVLVLTILAGCETYDSGYGGTSVSVGYYHGSGWSDPYYRRRCCYYNRPPPPPNYRPPGHRPPGHRPPGNRPPGNRPPGHRPPGGPSVRPLPSVPRQPRPAKRRR
jgi:hypothetical protein